MKKEIRLKRSQDIGKIVLSKKRISCYYYTLYYEVNKKETKVAVVAGKKCGNAVERNYLKRTMREIIRINLFKIKNIHAVLIAKQSALDLSYNEKEQIINKMILQMIERIKK